MFLRAVEKVRAKEPDAQAILRRLRQLGWQGVHAPDVAAAIAKLPARRGQTTSREQISRREQTPPPEQLSLRRGQIPPRGQTTPREQIPSREQIPTRGHISPRGKQNPPRRAAKSRKPARPPRPVATAPLRAPQPPAVDLCPSCGVRISVLGTCRCS